MTRRNVTNFIAALSLLVVITACVCRSDRSSEDAVPPIEANATENQSKTSKTPLNNVFEDSAQKDKGDFNVEHEDVGDGKYLAFDNQIRQDKSLEKAAVRLNSALILPKDVVLRTKVCGKVNAFYDPNDASVTVCYELMEYFFNLFKRNGENEQTAARKMSETVQFVFLHEIGHALVDIYDLPVMANEEDAADRCSSYINIKELGDDGADAVLSAAEAFRIESKGSVPDKRRMADEHLLKEQRPIFLMLSPECTPYSTLQGLNGRTPEGKRSATSSAVR